MNADKEGNEIKVDRKKGNYGKEKPYYCTLFTKKNNKPVTTFSIDTNDEVGVKYTLILKGYLGSLEGKVFDNIKEFLFDKGKLNNKAIEIGDKFDKKFRLLVSNK